MRRLLVVAVMAGSWSAEARGTIEVRLGPAATEAHQAIRERARGSLQSFATLYSAVIRLPRSFAIDLRECDGLAFWDPERRSVTLCYGYYDFVESLVGRKHMNGAIAFTVGHEIAHALAAELDLPLVGRAEDAADQFAALDMLASGDARGAALLADAARFFQALRTTKGEGNMWDEHSTRGQRFYDLLCLIKGGQPRAYRELVADDVLPASRAERCAVEFRDARDGWNRLLEPHSGVQGGKTFAPVD